MRAAPSVLVACVLLLALTACERRRASGPPSVSSVESAATQVDERASTALEVAADERTPREPSELAGARNGAVAEPQAGTDPDVQSGSGAQLGVGAQAGVGAQSGNGAPLGNGALAGSVAQPEAVAHSGAAAQPGVIAEAQALELARSRWQRLSPQERASILDRFDEYSRLGASEQQELVQRARRMRETSQRVQSELPAPVRERLRQLEPDKRREAMREIVGDEARARGQEIRAKLPDAWIERLESAKPEERIAILGQFRDRHLKRIADFAIERLGTTLGLDEAERRRLQALPIDQRAEAVLDLRKRAIERDTSENGLPPGLTAEDWRELVRLEPQAFFSRVQQYRQRRVASEPQGGERPPPGALDPAGRAGPPPVATDPAGPPDGRVPPPAAVDGQPRDGEALTPERREGLERLLAAVQQRPEDVIELVDLPKDERRAKLFELRRARCVEILRAYRLVSPQKLSELEALGEKRFHEVLRHVLQPLRRAAPATWPQRDAPTPKSGSTEPPIVPGRNEGGRC